MYHRLMEVFSGEILISHRILITDKDSDVRLFPIDDSGYLVG